MQPLLFFQRTNAFVLTADIFTNTNTVLIYYYEKHLYNIRFTWIVQRKIVFLTLVLILFLSFTYFLEITINTPVFLFRLTETQIRIENLLQKYL